MKNKIDLLFILDVTSSMGDLIDDAKARMKDMLKKLVKEHDIDLKVGISFYRDHPSQESTFVTAVFDLASPEEVHKTISKADVWGGGDAPEAVLDGIIDGVNGLTWRDDSKRIAFLIGDAAPHGMVYEDPCCLCGLTWGDAVAALEGKSVTLYSIALGGLRGVVNSFKTLSTFTGGMYLEEGSAALDTVLKTLSEKLGEMDLSTKVLELLSEDMDTEKICSMLNIDREKLSELTTI